MLTVHGCVNIATACLMLTVLRCVNIQLRSPQRSQHVLKPNRVSQNDPVAAYGHLAETALIERLRCVDDSYLDTTIPSKIRERCCGVMFGAHANCDGQLSAMAQGV
jgi:hypothetical protein